MATVIEGSGDIGYVAIVVMATFITNIWMASRVGTARKKFNVNYPTLYALESENKDAKVFNCVQRGHQNFLEIVPFFFSLIFFAGLQHPKLASLFGLVFLAARVVYLVEYSSGDPKKRVTGARVGFGCIFALMGCTISFAVHQLFM